jgi:hypothetical protein
VPAAAVTEGLSARRLATLLPAIILLLPEAAWQKPWRLWHALLRSLEDEFEFPGTADRAPEASAASSTSRELAVLFVEAVGAPWTEALEARLAKWRGRPEYEWVVALRQAARVDFLNDALRRTALAAVPLDEPALAARLRALSPFERRRVVVLRETVGNRTLWTEPVLEQAPAVVHWHFAIPLRDAAEVELLVEGRVAGALGLKRELDGTVTVMKAVGLCSPFGTGPTRKLVASRAAATKGEGLLPLTRRTRARLQVSTEAVHFDLHWQQEEDNGW